MVCKVTNFHSLWVDCECLWPVGTLQWPDTATSATKSSWLHEMFLSWAFVFLCSHENPSTQRLWSSWPLLHMRDFAQHPVVSKALSLLPYSYQDLVYSILLQWVLSISSEVLARPALSIVQEFLTPPRTPPADPVSSGSAQCFYLTTVPLGLNAHKVI